MDNGIEKYAGTNRFSDGFVDTLWLVYKETCKIFEISHLFIVRYMLPIFTSEA